MWCNAPVAVYQTGSYSNAPPVGKLKTRHQPQEEAMQTALPQLPVVGKTYISQEDPTLSLYVEEVITVEQDEYGGAGFMVTCCNLEDKGNKDASGYEFVNDEWASFRFVQVAA